jgi:hypothetical protein
LVLVFLFILLANQMKIVIPEKILPESLDQPTLDQGESNASQAGP